MYILELLRIVRRSDPENLSDMRDTPLISRVPILANVPSQLLSHHRELRVAKRRPAEALFPRHCSIHPIVRRPEASMTSSLCLQCR